MPAPDGPSTLTKPPHRSAPLTPATARAPPKSTSTSRHWSRGSASSARGASFETSKRAELARGRACARRNGSSLGRPDQWSSSSQRIDAASTGRASAHSTASRADQPPQRKDI